MSGVRRVVRAARVHQVVLVAAWAWVLVGWLVVLGLVALGAHTPRWYGVLLALAAPPVLVTGAIVFVVSRALWEPEWRARTVPTFGPLAFVRRRLAQFRVARSTASTTSVSVEPYYRLLGGAGDRYLLRISTREEPDHELFVATSRRVSRRLAPIQEGSVIGMLRVGAEVVLDAAGLVIWPYSPLMTRTENVVPLAERP